MTLEVIAAGPLTTIQDQGRMGWAHLGAPRSGAVDRGALDLANRLVGNRLEAAALEITNGGLSLRLHTAAFVAVTGAPCPITVVGGLAPAHQQPAALPAGAVLSLGAPPRGLRSYLAVRGGVDAPLTLGSRSSDVFSGLGPPPLRDGYRLAIGDAHRDDVDAWPAVQVPERPGARAVRLWPGPRRHWFADDALAELVAHPGYTVQADSNRVGVRLRGVALNRRADVPAELPSEGLVDGAMQVTHDGQPLVFLADHPTTGGYPVVAVVDPDDLAVIAQARPGEVIRFAWRAR